MSNSEGDDMPVLKDYHCAAHGFVFEGWEPKCPVKGCIGEISTVFLKPVGLKSDSTKKNDETINQLAIDFNMTDIKSTREGDNQSGYYTRNNTTSAADLAKEEQQVKREARPGDAAIWGNKSGMNMKDVLRGGAFRSVNGESVGMNVRDAGNLTGPKAASYYADQDNLTIPK
jgi:hypothetical protein